MTFLHGNKGCSHASRNPAKHRNPVLHVEEEVDQDVIIDVQRAVAVERASTRSRWH
jgi:hypothetical protein